MATSTKYQPGEVDHQLAFAELDRFIDAPLAPNVEEGCWEIFSHYVVPKDGRVIPDSAFCDIPRSVFLDYVGARHGILMAGRASDAPPGLSPVVLSQNLVGWDRPRKVAYSRSVEPIFAAILDLPRLKRLGRTSRSTVAWPFARTEFPSNSFYFALDYRALGEAPWRSGFVDLFLASELPTDFWVRPFLSENPILPVASVRVRPEDWPLISKVAGVDPLRQEDRMRDSFQGFPWRSDDEVHPGRWKREPARLLRKHIEDHPDEPIDLARLGKMIGLSSSAALRIYRAVYGLSPREYSLHLRIGLAREILRAGKTIAETALELGFYDQSHFTSHFRLVLGLTPGHYLRTQESPRRRADRFSQ